jgi:hypothetical protein
VRFSLKTLIVATTLIAIVAFWCRPATIVVSYRLTLPDDLPPTVIVTGGLGNPPLTYGGEEWYRH